jgi:AraC-like DNA-binding protein
VLVSGIERREFGVYYGRTNPALMAGGFRFTESTYEMDEALPAHEHELPHFCYVEAGQYEETLGIKRSSMTHIRKASALLYLPAGLPHREQHRAPGRHFMIEASERRLESLNLEPAQIPQELPPEELLFFVFRLIKEYHTPTQDSETVMEGLALALFGSVQKAYNTVRMVGQQPAWLRRTRETLDHDFLMPWTLDAMSHDVGVDPEHLTSRFSQDFGVTPAEFLRIRRVRYACQLLVKGDMSLREIALEAGFADSAHFSRVFSHYTGMSPLVFVRNVRGPKKPGTSLLRRVRRDEVWDELGSNDLRQLLEEDEDG